MVNGEVESEARDMEVGSAGWVRVERGVRALLAIGPTTIWTFCCVYWNRRIAGETFRCLGMRAG